MMLAQLDADAEFLDPFLATFLLKLVKNFAYKLTVAVLTNDEFSFKEFIVEELWDAAQAAGVPTGTVKLIYKVITIAIDKLDKDISETGELKEDGKIDEWASEIAEAIIESGELD